MRRTRLASAFLAAAGALALAACATPGVPGAAADGPAPQGQPGVAFSGARPTARELATLAQWLANGGNYGDHDFASPETFNSLLPQSLAERFPGIAAVEGIGMHWTPHPNPAAAPGAQRPEDFFFSRRTVGHGSLTGCMFLADRERQVVVAQVRQQTGPRYAEWTPRFVAAINAALAG